MGEIGPTHFYSSPWHSKTALDITITILILKRSFSMMYASSYIACKFGELWSSNFGV